MRDLVVMTLATLVLRAPNFGRKCLRVTYSAGVVFFMTN